MVFPTSLSLSINLLHFDRIAVRGTCCHCYRRSSVVWRSVTIVSPAKTNEPIELPFQLWTRVRPRNYVL